MFPSPLQKTLDVFHMDLTLSKYQQFPIDKLFCKFINPYKHLKDIQTIILINIINKKNYQLEIMDENDNKPSKG
jgi:hypothetical protein